MDKIWEADLNFLIFSHFGSTFKYRNLCFRNIFYHDFYDPILVIKRDILVIKNDYTNKMGEKRIHSRISINHWTSFHC